MAKTAKKLWGIFNTVGNIWPLIQYLGLPKISLAVGGGIVMGIWSYIQNIPLPIVVILGLLAVLIILWVWNGITWRKEKRISKFRLIGDQNKDNHKWLTDLAGLQATELGKYISCFVNNIDYSNFKGLSPTIKIILLVINRSVYSISSKDLFNIASKLDDEILPLPRISSLPFISPGDVARYELTFELNPTWVQKIKTDTDNHKCIDFQSSFTWNFFSHECGKTNTRVNLSYKHIPLIAN